MRTIVEAEAAAVEMRAQAEANAERQRADAHLFAEEKRAAGIAKIWAADNEGLNNMWKAVAGDSQLLQVLLTCAPACLADCGLVASPEQCVV